MTTTDSNGIVFLQDTDNISPFHTLINGLQTATSTAVEKAGRGPFYAADSTARAALYTAHGASSTNPLWVDMAGTLYRTTDGSTWDAYAFSDTTWTNLSLDTGAATVDGLTPQIMARGNVAYLSGRVIQNNSTIATIPSGMRPRTQSWRMAVTVGSSGTTTGVLLYNESTFKISTAAGATINLNGISWPIEN